MHWIGWLLVVGGVLGLLACVTGMITATQTRSDVEVTIRELSREAREVLDTVDAKLDRLPGWLNKLTASEKPGPVVSELIRLESGLMSAGELVDSVLGMLDAARHLQHKGEGTVDERFPTLTKLSGSLAELATEVRAQIDNVETWTLRFAVIRTAVDRLQEDVRTMQNEVLLMAKSAGISVGIVGLIVNVFLAWMGAGQLALVLAGQRIRRPA